MMFKVRCFLALCCIIQGAAADSKGRGNPADDLVEILEKNRTAHRLPELINNPGLGCIALQYAEKCQGNCTTNNTINCHPLMDDFTQVFAPNCGVELPTFAAISGYAIGCQQEYLAPSEAFAQVLARDQKSLSLMLNKSHTEVGVGVVGTHKRKGPFLWCVLFSNGQANTTFVLDDLGEGIKQKKGCYSGTTDPCSSSSRGDAKNGESFMKNWTILSSLCLLFLQQILLNII